MRKHSGVVSLSVADHFEAIHPVVRALDVPPGWEEVPPQLLTMPVFGARCFKGRGMLAFVNVESFEWRGGGRWLHLSVSRRSRVPDYSDLAMVKRHFIGAELPAYQIFPKATEHRNLHDFTLHLWSPLDADPFPDPFLERANTVAP